MHRSIGWTSILVLATAGACATSTPGAKPHDMSAAHHAQEAAAHSAEADRHAAQFDPSASTTRERCRERLSGVERKSSGDICWTSVTNPTDGHLKLAREHRQHATDHRAASSQLRDAEASACVGINQDDREISPFERTEDISGVERLTERAGTTKQPVDRPVGAVVTFRATPGLTAEWLQRVVDCHLARNAALGHAAPDMPNCPLVPNGVQARVTSTGNSFAVAIRSDDATTSKEILMRAERLHPVGATK